MKRGKTTEVKDTQEVVEQKQWRFFRSNLATVVWDARPGKNCSMADFSKGYFTTDDEEVAAILQKKGYPQIPLNMTEPPNIIVNQPSPQLLSKHVPLMPGAGNISGEAAEIAGSRMMDGVVSVPQVQPQNLVE